MPRITTKGQITIPKNIRDQFNIKTHDIGEFTVKDGSIIFTVKKGTILDAITKKTNKATLLFNYIGFGGSNHSIILRNEK